MLAVSIDFLLGADVPAPLVERTLIGDLARELTAPVMRDYSTRTTRERRDGLASAMGGQLIDVEAPRPEKRGDPWPPPPMPGDSLGPGRMVTHMGLISVRALDVDPQQFLERVCARIHAEAEAWEEANSESERQAVRDDVRLLSDDLDTVAEAMGRDRETVYRWLLDGALNPLDKRAQAGVKVAGHMWRQHKAGKEALRAAFDEAVATAVRAMNDEVAPGP